MFNPNLGTKNFAFTCVRMQNVSLSVVSSARREDILKCWYSIFESSLRANIELGFKPEQLMASA